MRIGSTVSTAAHSTSPIGLSAFGFCLSTKIFPISVSGTVNLTQNELSSRIEQRRTPGTTVCPFSMSSPLSTPSQGAVSVHSFTCCLAASYKARARSSWLSISTSFWSVTAPLPCTCLTRAYPSSAILSAASELCSAFIACVLSTRRRICPWCTRSPFLAWILTTLPAVCILSGVSRTGSIVPT